MSLGLHHGTWVRLCNHLGAFKWRHLCYAPVTWKLPSDCTAVPRFRGASQVTKRHLLCTSKSMSVLVTKKDADATIKILSVCTAVPGYSRRNNQNSKCLHSRTQVRSCKPKWQIQKDADATIKFLSVCTAVPRYGRASPSDRYKKLQAQQSNF